MRKELKATLDKTGLPSYHIRRPEKTFPCIVYVINEYEGDRADCIEESAKYDIYLHLYIKEDISENVEKIKKHMILDGFNKVAINSPTIFDGLDYHIVTFNFTKRKANKFD